MNSKPNKLGDFLGALLLMGAGAVAGVLVVRNAAKIAAKISDSIQVLEHFALDGTFAPTHTGGLGGSNHTSSLRTGAPSPQ